MDVPPFLPVAKKTAAAGIRGLLYINLIVALVIGPDNEMYKRFRFFSEKLGEYLEDQDPDVALYVYGILAKHMSALLELYFITPYSKVAARCATSPTKLVPLFFDSAFICIKSTLKTADVNVSADFFDKASRSVTHYKKHESAKMLAEFGVIVLEEPDEYKPNATALFMAKKVIELASNKDPYRFSTIAPIPGGVVTVKDAKSRNISFFNTLKTAGGQPLNLEEVDVECAVCVGKLFCDFPFLLQYL